MGAEPTCVIGVGRAGIDTLTALDEQLADADRDQFRLVGIDSDAETLRSAPDRAGRIFLEANPDVFEMDRAEYPYLTRGMDHSAKGSRRQRPVGRYKLDNRHTAPRAFDALWTVIDEHVDDRQTALDTPGDRLSVYLVGSLAGGTGSGAVPLLAAMLEDILDAVGDDLDESSLVGVGFVPSLVDTPHRVPADSVSYLNAYAALQDVETLLSAAADDPVELPVYGVQGTDGVGTGGVDIAETRTVDAPPFDDYVLVGQRERPSSASAADVPATYRTLVDRRVAVAILARSLSRRRENDGEGEPRTGTVDRSAVRVPHDRVRELTGLEAEQRQCGADIEALEQEINELERRRRVLESVRENPADAPEQLGNVETAELRDRIERELPGLASGAVTPDDVSAFVDEVDGELGVGAALYATTLLDERFPADELERLESAYAGLVERLWKRYDAATQPGGSEVESVGGRASFLVAFLEETLEEALETRSEVAEGLLDLVPPYADALESDREALDARIDRLREDLSDLERLRERVGRLRETRDAIRTERSAARLQVGGRTRELETERMELEDELRERREKRERIEADIEALRTALAEAHTARPLAILPISLDALDALGVETADDVDATLSSLDDYVANGLVEEGVLTDALEQAVGFSTAWDDPALAVDAESDGGTGDLWALYAEDNADLVEEFADVGATTDADVVRASGDGIDHLPDPYRVEFVSIARRGPLSATALYRKLDELADEGVLAELRGPYDDWRQAFAYPEWYGRAVREAFDIVSRATVPRPPEPDPDRMTTTENDGERAAYIKTNGLDAYLWQGVDWEQYERADELFDGWKPALSRNAVSFADLQRATPATDLKGKWLVGEADWDDVVDAYRENLVDEAGIEVTFR